MTRWMLVMIIGWGATNFSFAGTEFSYASKPVVTLRRMAPAPPNPPPQISIWCEFEPYDSVRKYLPAMAERKINLFLHVSTDDIGNPDLLALLREADQRGVKVFAWLLLPYEQHLYVGEWTLAPTRRLALDFAAWIQRERVGLRWIIFDCEPAPDIGKQMYAQIVRLSVTGLASYLSRQKDPKRFAASADDLNSLIDDLHARGFKVLGSCNRVILDGLRYGNITWQDAFNIPFSMIHWDRVSFITYRYRASRRYYLAMVRRYSSLAVRYFGDRAGIDVGLIGDNRSIPENQKRLQIFGGNKWFLSYLDGISSPREMSVIIATAREAGIRYVNLYSLDGAFHSGKPAETWLGCADVPVDMQLEVDPTPVGSLKAGLTSFLLNGAFCILVREEELPPYRNPREQVGPR